MNQKTGTKTKEEVRRTRETTMARQGRKQSNKGTDGYQELEKERLEADGRATKEENGKNEYTQDSGGHR